MPHPAFTVFYAGDKGPPEAADLRYEVLGPGGLCPGLHVAHGLEDELDSSVDLEQVVRDCLEINTKML